MPKSSKRNRQVADLIQREIAIALRQEIRDPRLAQMVITDVVLTPDFRQAKIYFSLLKNSELAPAQDALRRAAGHFRRLIAAHAGLRHTPELHFYYDETLVRAEKLDHLLNDIVEDKTDASENP